MIRQAPLTLQLEGSSVVAFRSQATAFAAAPFTRPSPTSAFNHHTCCAAHTVPGLAARKGPKSSHTTATPTPQFNTAGPTTATALPAHPPAGQSLPAPARAQPVRFWMLGRSSKLWYTCCCSASIASASCTCAPGPPQPLDGSGASKLGEFLFRVFKQDKAALRPAPASHGQALSAQQQHGAVAY